MRKFIQPVAMRVTREQYQADLQEFAETHFFKPGVDYRPKRFEDYDFLAAHQEDGLFLLCQQKHLSKETYIVVDYNPELFLALASMSEGGCWEGEWVWHRGGLFKATLFHDGKMGSNSVVTIISLDGDSNDVGLGSIRKATAEEIIAHFTEKKAVEQKATEFADKMKLSKAVEEWVPKVDEEIWVWNTSKVHKKRISKRFAFFTTDNRVAVYHAFDPDHYSVDVQFYEHFAKIDAPIHIPLSYAKNLIALERGVPVELIQIDR